jgi:hypothetical protein
MKNLKKVLALVLAVVMIMGVVTVASAKTYKDADKEAYKTYADAIDALSSLKILDGFEDGEFKADRTFNRAQAAKIVAIVHNAATNGKIKDQTAISALYSNAQNPFVDCNTSWALPYINYCRITGLADGMTATTYAPKRELTGVQWLKLMLTTLNFDTAKEGYTGTGWDVNVLNRANEVGLTAGLADDWKAIAPIKRGEAAQILYNALTKYLVEYGQLVKNNYDTTGKYYKTAFISNEQVAKSGYTLGAKMGISIERATDDFRRPGYAWSYGSWSAFYMDKPLNSYTSFVTACDILKNDIGIPETKTTAVNLNGLYKGKVTTTGYTQTSKASVLKVDGEFVDNTALNYYAVDGYKYTNVVLQHDAAKNCQKANNTNKHWSTTEFGGTGDLTQVFKTEDGYVITVIHTFLGEVDSFVGTNKYSHATTAKATAKVWLNRGSEDPTYAEGNAYVAVFKGINTTDFAKGTKVLVTMSFKDTEAANLTGAYGRTNEADAKLAENVKKDAYVVSTVAAESKTGKLTGASDLFYGETVSIDGTKYNANCRFVLGTNDAMNIKNNGETYTFYFDSYGNVIGLTENATESSYVVMDKVYAYIDKGVFTIKADLYDLSGNKLDDVTVSNKAGSFKGFGRATNETQPAGKQISIYAEANDPWFTNALYTYTTDDKGVYTLTWVGLDVAQDGYGRAKGMFTHIAKTAYLGVKTTNIDNIGSVINLSESTKFVCKGADGTWKSFTGYTALPALTAQYVDYTVESGNTYASIVYLGGVTYEGDSITGYVATWKPFNWANGYALVTVYVDGEAKVVNVKPEGTLDGVAYNLNGTDTRLKPGMYKFTTKVDADGVTYSDVVTAEETKLAQGIAHVNGSSNDVTAFTVEGNPKAFNLTDVKIYLVKANGTIEEADKTWIDGAYVVVYGKAADNYATTVYVFDSFAELPDGTIRP